jgi:hypothetical protein
MVNGEWSSPGTPPERQTIHHSPFTIHALTPVLFTMQTNSTVRASHFHRSGAPARLHERREMIAASNSRE